MTRYGRALCAWAVIGGAVAAGTHLNGQSAVQIGAAPVTHIGVVVRDIEEATRHFADVVGMQPLQIRTIQIDLPDKKQAEIKRATAQLPNLRIEFDQPVTESGPDLRPPPEDRPGHSPHGLCGRGRRGREARVPRAAGWHVDGGDHGWHLRVRRSQGHARDNDRDRAAGRGADRSHGRAANQPRASLPAGGPSRRHRR